MNLYSLFHGGIHIIHHRAFTVHYINRKGPSRNAKDGHSPKIVAERVRTERGTRDDEFQIRASRHYLAQRYLAQRDPAQQATE